MTGSARSLAPVLLCLLAPCAEAALRPPLRLYTSADGLSRDAVEELVFDDQGFLWIGTDGGLCRFDGERFTRFGAADGLHGEAIYDIALGANGTHWVTTDLGLFVFRAAEASPAGRLFRQVHLDGLPDDQFHRVLVDRAGTAWVGTFSRGLWRVTWSGEGYRGARVEVPGLKSRVQSLAEDPSGSIWVGSHLDGLYRVRTDGAVDHAASTIVGAGFVRSFHFPADGSVWTASFSGVAIFRDGPFGALAPASRVYGNAEGMEIDTGDLVPLGSDRVLVSTTVGVIEMRRSGPGWNDWEVGPTIDRRSGLPQDPVRAITLDAAGNIWLGMFNRGVVKLVRNGLSTASAVEGGSKIVDLETDREGRVAVLASQGAMALTAYRPDGDPYRVSLPRGTPYVGWGDGQKLLVDHLGSWWIATGAGLLRFDDPRSLGPRRIERPPDAVYGPAEGVAGTDIYVVAEDGRGDVWMSSNALRTGGSAVSRWSRETGRIEIFPEATVGTRSLALRFHALRDGTVWIPFTDGRLVRVRGDRFETILTDIDFVDLVQDRQGRVWTAGRPPKVCKDPGAERPSFLPVELPGADETVTYQCVCEGEDGRIWYGTTQGIVGYAPDGGPVHRLTAEDGLNGGNIFYCARDGAGALWFSDGGGLSRLVAPRTLAPALPRARLREIRIAGEAVPLPSLGISEVASLRIPADRRRLSLDFFAVHADAGPPLRFQYRLDRPDSTWSVPARSQSVQYDQLSPGRYRFLVRTVGEDGVASDAPATVAIHVMAPVWQRAWFLALCFAAGAGLVYSVHRARIARAVAVERLRTRIATDLHDDVGSSLSQIAILSQLAGRRPELQERITALAGEVVDAMGDVVWAISPRSDTLAALTTRMRRFASELFADDAVSLELALPGEGEQRMDPDVRRQLYLVFKEALHNVRRHARARRIRVELADRGKDWNLAVEEDGRGFDPERESAGHGMASMRQRAERLGGRLSVASSPEGTRLTLAIPKDGGRKLWNR